MQKPRSPPIASTGAQIGGKMAKMPIWHRWVVSAADYLLRQIGSGASRPLAAPTVNAIDCSILLRRFKGLHANHKARSWFANRDFASELSRLLRAWGPVRSGRRGPGHQRIYRGRSDERRQALEQCGGQCSKGRPQHPMLQYGRYCVGCRCNRMALVLRGSQDCVWLDRVGLSPRGALTKGTGSSTSRPPRVS